MRKAWRYNTDHRRVIEAERLKHGAEVPVVHLSGDREIEGCLDACSPTNLIGFFAIRL